MHLRNNCTYIQQKIIWLQYVLATYLQRAHELCVHGSRLLDIRRSCFHPSLLYRSLSSVCSSCCCWRCCCWYWACGWCCSWFGPRSVLRGPCMCSPGYDHDQHCLQVFQVLGAATLLLSLPLSDWSSKRWKTDLREGGWQRSCSRWPWWPGWRRRPGRWSRWTRTAGPGWLARGREGILRWRRWLFVKHIERLKTT